MTETILKSILFGFGIYSIGFFLIKRLLSETLKIKIEKFDNSACTFISVIGLTYLLVWFGTLLFQYSNQEDATAIYQIKSRLFGTYWVSYWLPLLLFLSSQLLWIKKLREIHLIRIVIALSLIAPMQSFLIALTTVHRDYLPSTWTISISSRIIEWLFSIGIFGLTALAFHLVKLRFKRLKDV